MNCTAYRLFHESSIPTDLHIVVWLVNAAVINLLWNEIYGIISMGGERRNARSKLYIIESACYAGENMAIFNEHYISQT